MTDKRKFTRVELQTKALVRGAQIQVDGEVRNLSLDGLFLLAEGRVPIGETVSVEMVLSGPSTELSIELDARVVRHDERGFALRFERMAFAFDAYLHLRNVIAYQRGDIDATAEEFKVLLAEQAKEDSF